MPFDGLFLRSNKKKREKKGFFWASCRWTAFWREVIRVKSTEGEKPTKKHPQRWERESEGERETLTNVFFKAWQAFLIVAKSLHFEHFVINLLRRRETRGHWAFYEAVMGGEKSWNLSRFKSQHVDTWTCQSLLNRRLWSQWRGWEGGSPTATPSVRSHFGVKRARLFYFELTQFFFSFCHGTRGWTTMLWW